MSKKKGNNPKKGKDLITGNWNTIESGPSVVIDTNPRSNSDPVYFGIFSSGSGSTVNYNGYRDANGNRNYDPGIDTFVGTASVTSLDDIVYNSGTFRSRRGSFDAFVNGNQVATGTGFETWFGGSSNSPKPSKPTKKPKRPKTPSSSKDAITGNWTTENGIILDIDITSGNTPYAKYFAVAVEIIDVMTARYRNYGDANNNGQFDPAADKPFGEWTVRSQDGIPYYVGSFTYKNGTFNATSGVFDIPVNPFI